MDSKDADMDANDVLGSVVLAGAPDPALRFPVPAAVARAGDRSHRRFVEFFTATIRNPNTRAAYARAVGHFFAWVEEAGIRDVRSVTSVDVSTYIETLCRTHSAPTVKLSLAAIRRCLDYLTTGGVLDFNPATVVKGPAHSVGKGKTPVLDGEEARRLIESIPTTKTDPKTGETRPDLVGLRDRALIATMIYSFARVSAAVGIAHEDYYQQGRRMWFRLHEKGGKRHEVPAHHKAEEYLDAWIAAAGITDRRAPLFQTLAREPSAGDGSIVSERSVGGPGRGAGRLTGKPMSRFAAWEMVKRRAKAAGLSAATCNHSFRATGITAYLSNGGTLERAQNIANHADSRTTKLYDRTSDDITLDEIEKILL